MKDVYGVSYLPVMPAWGYRQDEKGTIRRKHELPHADVKSGRQRRKLRKGNKTR